MQRVKVLVRSFGETVSGSFPASSCFQAEDRTL